MGVGEASTAATRGVWVRQTKSVRWLKKECYKKNMMMMKDADINTTYRILLGTTCTLLLGKLNYGKERIINTPHACSDNPSAERPNRETRIMSS